MNHWDEQKRKTEAKIRAKIDVGRTIGTAMGGRELSRKRRVYVKFDIHSCTKRRICELCRYTGDSPISTHKRARRRKASKRSSKWQSTVGWIGFRRETDTSRQMNSWWTLWRLEFSIKCSDCDLLRIMGTIKLKLKYLKKGIPCRLNSDDEDTTWNITYLPCSLQYMWVYCQHL